MVLPLIFFIASGLVIVALIVHKKLELSHGKGLVVLDALSGFDHKVTRAAGKIKESIALINKRNAFHFLNSIFVFVVRTLLTAVEWARERIHVLYEKAQHKHSRISGNGEASVYLKRISEVKEEPRSD